MSGFKDLHTDSTTTTVGSSEAKDVNIVGSIGLSVTGTVFPTGYATTGLQVTGNTSLSSIDLKIPSLGQSAMTGSVPVVIASNQSTIPIKPTTFTQTGTASANSTDLFTRIDVSDYRAISIQLAGTWSGTVRLQVSNDDITYYDVTVIIPGSVTNPPVTTMTANGMYVGAAFPKYMKLRTTSWSSGTVTCVVIFSTTNAVDLGNRAVLQSTSAWPVSNYNSQQLGNVTGLNQSPIAFNNAGSFNLMSLQFDGTWVADIECQGSDDNTTFFTLPIEKVVYPPVKPISKITSNGLYNVILGMRYFRILSTAYTSGTAVVNANATTRNIAGHYIQDTTLAGQSVLTSGSITTLGDIVGPITNDGIFKSFLVQLEGTLAYSTVIVEGRNDTGMNWVQYSMVAVKQDPQAPVTTIYNQLGIFRGSFDHKYIQFRCTAYTSGSATVKIYANNTPMEDNRIWPTGIMAIDPNTNLPAYITETEVGSKKTLDVYDNAPAKIYNIPDRAIVSIGDTTAVQIAANTDQIWIRMEPTTASGPFFWGWTQAEAQNRTTSFRKYAAFSGPFSNSIWVVRSAGAGSANINVDRGYK